MARKRAERQEQPGGVSLIEKPKPQRVSATPTGEYRQAFCPVCGRAAGVKRLKYPYQQGEAGVATQNFWEYTKDFDPAKTFGVIQEVGGGKGHSFSVIGYFNPEEDIDGYFPLVKARLLTAVKEWLNKGWLTEEEVADLISH